MPRILGLLFVAIGAMSAIAGAEPLKVLAYETDGFFFRDADGAPRGFEHDILEYYARSKSRPLEIEWVQSFDRILEAMRSGDADVAAATVTITPERERVMDFSGSYFPVRVMLVAPIGRGTTALEDLRGARLATIRGTTLEKILAPIPDVELVFVEGQRELFEAVASGRADATAVDSAVAFMLLPDFPALELGIPLSEQQHYGFAVPEGSPLAKELEAHITQLKEAGFYYRLLEKYLGAEAVRTVKLARETP